MRKLFLLTSMLAMIFFVPQNMNAQDIVDVAVLPPGNINDVIVGDTTAGGLRANPDRIYRLQRGAVYQVTEPMRVNGNLHIIATDVSGDPDDAANRPPVLAPAILSDNSSIGTMFQFIGEDGVISLSDVYILGIRADQNWLGWGTGMQINADRISVTMRNVIMEGWSNVAIEPNGQFYKMDVEDCYFRNNQHTGSWFGGQVMRGPGGVHPDTVIFRNNTFFANNSYLWDIRGYDNYSVFEHNTCVFGVVNPFLIRQASNAHINNNVFYSMHAFGGNPTHVYDGWFLNYPDTASTSIFRTRGQDSTSAWAQLWDATISGPEAWEDSENGITLEMLDPMNRVVDTRNNAYHYPQQLWDFYDAYNDTVTIADSIGIPGGDRDLVVRTMKKPRWITDYAQWTLDNLYPTTGVTATVTGNQDMDPGFDAAVTGHLSELTNYLLEISTGTIDEETWHYDPNDALYPPAWPVPEDLAYTNSTMQSAGTDGFALGDLNWFPDQKASWLTGIKKVNELSNKYELSDNYPNPFNPSTKINFSIANSGMVSLKVFNILGQEVTTLVNEQLNSGSYTFDFDASTLSSGIYFYTLSANDFTMTKKMMLLK